MRRLLTAGGALLLAAGGLVLLRASRPGTGDGASAPLPSTSARAVESLPAGPVLLGRAPAERTGTSEPGAAASQVPSTVPGGAVSGRVLGPDEAPLADVEVLARVDDVSRRVLARARSGADGAYRLEGLPRGLHRVEARLTRGDDAWERTSLAAAPLDGHDLRLTQVPPALRVLVVDAEGRPVPSFCICGWSAARGAVLAPTSGRDGRLDLRLGIDLQNALEDVEQVVLQACDARDEHGAALPLGSAAGPPLPQGAREVTLRLPVTSAAAGRILLPDGSGCSHLPVTMRLAPAPGSRETPGLGARLEDDGTRGAEPTPLRMRTRTDASGRYTFGLLRAEAEHVASFEVPPSFEPLAPVRIQPGEQAPNVQLVVRPCVTVTVLKPDGTLLSDVILIARHEGGSVQGQDVESDPRTTGEGALPRPPADGQVRLYGLDPALRYELSAVTWPASEQVLDAAWAPRDQVLRLRRLRTVIGRVLDASGAPVAEVEVRLVEAQGLRGGTSMGTRRDGGFALDAVPVQAVTLEAVVRHADGAETTVRLAVAADAEDVVIRLPPRTDVNVRLVWPTAATGADRNVALLLRQDDWSPWRYRLDPGVGLPGGEDVVLRGLDAARRYALFAHSEELGLWARARFSGDAQVVTLTFEPGLATRIRVRGAPDTANSMSVELDSETEGQISLWPRLERGAWLTLPGIPPGPWRVTARCFDGARWLEGTGTVEAGAEVALTLAPR